MTSQEFSHLRIVREPEPLQSYIRPLHRDYSFVARLLAEGKAVGTGLIVDACDPSRSADLRQLGSTAGLEVILDPRSVELSTIGGIQRSGVIDLPWSSGEVDTPESMTEIRRNQVATSLVEAALEMSASAILAPTHFLDSFPSPWFEIDLSLAERIRFHLDRDRAGRRVRIYYPLVSGLRTLISESVRDRVRDGLRRLVVGRTIDAIWLRMHAFGTTSSGPLSLTRYIRTARSFHQLGVPVIAERTGTVGIPLMALGCVTGIESSITHGDRCDVKSLQRPPQKGGGGGLAPRVYLSQIGAFLKRESAAEFLNNRSIRNWFTCQETCCARGTVDMLRDPRRHFIVTRSAEVSQLEAVPHEVRAEHYFSSWLRPASDRATRASRVLPSLLRHRDRLDQWRSTLSEIKERDAMERPTVSASLPERYRDAV